MKLADGIAMHGEDLGGLAKFVVVAEEQSFTRAAAKLGISQSALTLLWQK